MTSHSTGPSGKAIDDRPSFLRRIAGLLLPENESARRRLYVAVAMLLYCAAWALLVTRAYVRHTRLDFAIADAVGYYAYLPTLVIDHDLRFRNQLETQLDSEQLIEELAGAGQQGVWGVSAERNRFPIGIAISVLPGFLVAHGLSLLVNGATGSMFFEPNGYTILYFVFTVANAMAVGTAAMIYADRLLTERFGISGRCAAAAVLTYWLGSNMAWFWLREPLVAHLIGASWIVFVTYLVHRIEFTTRRTGATLPRWCLPMLAFATSMALVCRFTNVFVFPLLLYAGVTIARRGLLPAAMKQAPFALLALWPLLAQSVVLNVMNGHVLHQSPQELGYRPIERFYWTRPALVLSLISSRRGVFTWTPVLLLSVWGWIWAFRRRRAWRDPLLGCLGLSALVLWYVNASWYAWWFGTSAGNRAYIELAIFFIVGFGFAFTWLVQVASTSARRVAIAVLVLGFLVNYGVVASKLFNVLENNQPVLPLEKRLTTGAWHRF